ncbi:prenylated flavin chaperone LpdD [Cohnella cholangitidis]|uniref:Prenylated flavin chaperone LpdD-like domain-containing protein n=1 Tax=Cohnella cholangitidis TaxID=2598458 RepID=A0A7G5C5N6_9BACL|nr:hypothetical protein [Cohnella cholangitidis]QMV44520.1 hypothetical protein FPL14_27625 [Cohnella cholangitidis]
MSSQKIDSKWSEAIRIRSIRMGVDVAFIVTGGKAHIGAAATAYWSEDGNVRVNALSLPGHREEELAAELATMASRSLRRTVAVVAGLHFEQPTKQDIEAIVAEARNKMKQVLNGESGTTE